MKTVRILLASALFAGCATARPTTAPVPAPAPVPAAPESDAIPPAPPVAVAGDTTKPEPPARWQMLDPEASGIYGAAVDRAYSELLQGRQPRRTVVVAIIDSGVDTAHVDLHANLWTNPREIAGNGRDDDGNGYIDDIHGWDFIGGAGGRDVGKDTYEVTRMYARCKAGGPPPPQSTCDEVKKAYSQKRTETESELVQIRSMDAAVDNIVAVLKSQIAPDTLTAARVAALKPVRNDVAQAQALYMQLVANDLTPAMIKDEVARLQGELDFGLNPDYDPRKIVGDHYTDPEERFYGNNNIVGPDPMHGTGVSSLIGALRDGRGVDGIASAVRLMVLRAVPDGDERDKDIANAIRYAVDNGASIINMSFGKPFSPYKAAVDDAVRYADSKGVLMVHAAGNDAENLETARNYPTRVYLDGTSARNWLEVGASTWKSKDELAAEYSNYGKTQVDLFAPGSDILLATPGNEYSAHSGTSFASPVVAGVAALIMSYYPSLTAADVRKAILDSVTPMRDVTVATPGSDSTVRFGDLSASGGVVNAYAALKVAAQIASTRIP